MNTDLNHNSKHCPDDYARLLAASPAVLYACGPGPNYPTTFITENVAAQLGYRPEEFYRRPFFWTEQIHPEDADRVLRELSRIDQVKRLSYEYRFRHKEGRYLWLHDELTPLKDADGNVVGLVGSWFDISERKQAEEALKIKDRAIESSINAMAFAEFGGNLTYVNRAFLDLWGYADDQEVLGRPATDFWQFPERAREVVEALRGTGGWAGEMVARRKDGSLFDAQLSASMVRDKADKPAYMMCSLLDISQRKQAEEALRDSEQLLAKTLDSLHEAVFIVAADTVEIRDCNRAAERIFGYRRDEMLGQTTVFLHVDEAALEEFRGHLYPAVEKHGFLYLPAFRMKRKDGTLFFTEHTVTQIRDHQGRRVAWVSVVRDVTERRRAEEALRQAHDELERRVEERTSELASANQALLGEIVERKQAERALRASEERLRYLLTAGPSVIYTCQVERDYPATYMSDNVKAQLGYEAHCFTDDPHFWARNIHPEDAPRVFAELPQLLERGFHTHEYRFRHKDGTWRWMRDEMRLVRDAQGNPREIVGHWVDVSERRRAEEALRESERRYRAIVEDQTELICRWVPGYRHTFVNDAYCRCFGKSREELIGQSFMSLIPEEDHPKALEHFALLCRQKPVATHEHRVIAAGGQIRWHEWTDRAIFDAHDNIVEYQSVGHDITGHRRAEEALQESERKVRAILDHTFQFIGLMTPEGTLIEANRSALDFAGLGESDVLGKPFWETPWWTHSSELQGRLRDAVGEAAAGHFVRFEATHLGADGALHSIDFSLKPVKGEAGNVDLLIPEGRDITERKRAEEALKESEELFRTVVDASKDAMVAINRDGLVTLFNPAAEEMFGRKGEEVLGRSLDCLMPERYRAPHRHYVEQYFRAGFPREAMGRTLELPAVRKDGREFPVELSLSAGQRGREPFVLAVIRDITERKQAEDTLRKQTEILENVLAHIPHSVFWKDTNSVYLGCNENFAREAGLATPEQVIGKTDYDLPWRREQTEFYRQCDREVITTGRLLVNIEEPQRRADGSHATLITSKTPLRDRDGKVIGVLGIYADITERKRAEETLRRQALVFDNMYDGVLVVDTQDQITDWNPGAERIFGYAKAGILGRSPEVLNRPDEAPDLTRSIKEAIARVGRWAGEVRFVRADGGEGVCEVVCVPLYDDDGRVMGRVSVNRDITDRLRAEEEVRRRQEELAHVTRLATMGEMATGLAHELNQPLSAILYYARGCERRLRAGGWDVDEVLGAVDKVAAQAGRAAAFIDRLRAFVRKGGPNLAPIDLNHVVREAVGFAEPEVRQNGVNINLQLSAPLPPVLADMIQIEQVILNLLRNAIEAMQHTDPAERRLTLQTSGAGGEAITVAVADNGCGYSDEVAERLFDAFFTSKPDGMGMGLAVSRSIIELHGGRLWATPNADGGTTFRFTLPVAPGGPMS